MGVETNTYQIPDLVLSDTFHEWFTVTNNSIIEKLNLMQVYDLGAVTISGQGTVVGDGISAGVDSSGSLFIEVGSTIDKDVTFNGNITVNGSTTTINSTEFSVDDFNIILGASATPVDDETIMNASGNSAGGGVIVKGSSGDKEFLWKHDNYAWNTNQNISFSTDKAILGATDIRLATDASGGTATKGVLFGFTAGSTAGAAGNDTLLRTFNTDIAAGHSADVMRITDDGYVHIANGANRITVNQTGHGLTFGNVVRINGAGVYVEAQANSPETAEVIGVVSRVETADRFEITTSGEIIGDFSAINDESATLTPGSAYFLSTVNAGNITGTKPTQNGEIQKTVLIGMDSDRAMVKNYIGGEVSLINQASQALTSNKIYVRVDGGHGLTFGDAVYATSTGGYARGVAVPDEDPTDHNSPTDIIGIVEDVAVGGDSEVFSLVMSGKFELAGGISLTQGDVYYLTKDVPDLAVGPNITNTRITDSGFIDKPLFVATGSNTGIISIQRGVENVTEVEDDIITDVPIGAIIPYHGTVAPDGYLLCDGEEYDTTVYNQLFALLGTSTTPDLRNKFIAGAGQDTGNYALGFEDGDDEVTLTVDEMPRHQHGVGRASTQDTSATGSGFDPSPDSGTNEETSFAGGGQPHENRPPFYALTYIIRADGVNPLADGTQILGGDTEFVDLYAGNNVYQVDIEAAEASLAVDQIVTSTHTIALLDLADSFPDLNVEQVRSVTMTFSSDCDALEGLVEYKFPGTDRYLMVYRDLGQDQRSTTIQLPVNPGQSTIELRSSLRKVRQTGDSGFGSGASNSDAIKGWVVGANQIVDNTLIRERKAYTDRKNLLINGDFGLWQRGVGLNGSPLTLASSGTAYAADRWVGKTKLSSGAPTLEQGNFDLSQTLVPGNPKHYLNIANPSSFNMATLGYIGAEQRIEDVRTFAGRNMTVSFWAKATGDGTCFASYGRFYGGTSSTDASDNDCSKLGSFTVGSQWRKYKFSVFVPPIPAGKTEGTDADGYANSFFGIGFYTAVKPDARGNDTGATISLGTNKTLSIAQVQVEEGARATDFERRSPGSELVLAQRYYSKSLAPHLAPTASGFPDKLGFFERSINNSATVDITFPVEMRATPACSLYGSTGVENTVRFAQFSTSNNGQLTGSATDVNVVTTTPSHRCIHSFSIEDDGNAHYDVTGQCNYTADAEL